MPGCPKPAHARRLCTRHHKRLERYGSVDGGGPERERFPESLLGRIEVAESGCWIFTGCLVSGYGHMRVDSRYETSHRLAYELLVGPIPDGLDLDHTCHNADPTCAGGLTCPHRACCNPEHLEPVTTAENNRRVGEHRRLVRAAA